MAMSIMIRGQRIHQVLGLLRIDICVQKGHKTWRGLIHIIVKQINQQGRIFCISILLFVACFFPRIAGQGKPRDLPSCARP